MQSDTIISALSWIRKGYASKLPKQFEMEDEEVEEMKQVNPELQEQIEQAQKLQKKEDKIKYANKNNNGTEELEANEFQDDDDDGDIPTFTAEFAQLKKGIHHKDENGYQFAIDEMSNEDKEDYVIKSTDALLVAAKIEKEFSSLEVYIYEQESSNLFVHHEITLSAFPLCLEWMPLNPISSVEGNNVQGNFIIVGTFLPEIEIWDLDVINAVEPSVLLGGELDEEQQLQIMQQQMKKKGKKVKKFNQQSKQSLFKEGSHTDSVLSLNLNSYRQNVLLSGSADTSVKIWDVLAQKNLHTFNSHTGKVQVVAWNGYQEAVMMSGGFDKNIVVQDARQPQNCIKAALAGDIESGGWCPYDENILYASTENGYVSVMDARKLQANSQTQYLANFKANSKQTTSVSFNPSIQGMLATTSMDKSVKIFDLNNVNNLTPKLVVERNPNTGSLFCGSFYKDSPWVYGCGNSQGEVFIWDTAESQAIVENFGGRVPEDARPNIKECTQGAALFAQKQGDSDEDDELYEQDEEESQQVMEQE